MRVSIVVCLLVCTLASTAFAQTATGGSIRGYVKDEQDAVLPGVRITATSADAPGDHVGIADEAGYYRLRNLPPATYTITAELDGFAKWTKPAVVVRAGLNISLSIVMQVGSLAESVDVTIETPLLETQAAVRGINISGDLARQLPLFARRHWTNFLAVTPGVLTTTLASDVNFYFVHGSNFDSQVALVDGADVNGASQSYSFNVNMSNETLEDVQVRTGGMDASAPLGTGVLINAVTKSGTNEPRGSAVLVLQPRRWNGSNADAGGTSEKASVMQSDFALGGPLRRNRSWLFGAYRYNRVVDDLARTPQQVLALRALSPSFAPFDRGNRSSFVFAKSTTQVTPDHRLTGSYRYDVNPLDGGSATDTALFGRSRTGGNAIAMQLASVWRRRWLSAMNASYNTTANPSELLRIDASSRPVAQSVLLSAGRLRSTGLIGTLDNSPTWSDQPNHKATVTADLSIPAGSAGRHEIQAGFYGQQLHVENITRYTNGGFATEELVLLNPNDPAAGTIPFHRQIFDADQATTRVIDATDIAFYLQDVWRPGARITITAGVRADIVKQTDRLFNLRSQDSVDVGPRAGLNYAVTSTPASGIRVNWSRRHDVISLTTGGTTAIGFRDVYDLNLDGVFETTFVTPGATVRSPDRQYDASRHQPYVDEFTAAYGIQIPGSTTLEVSAIDRRFKDAAALSEVNGIYDGGVFKGYRDISLNDVYLITNNRWNHAVYRGIEVSASKRASRLQAFGSYTRQWRHLEGTWQPNDPASFIEPDAFPNDKGLGRAPSDPTQANSLSGTSMAQNIGPASQWQDHVFNAAVNVTLRDRFKASASYVFSSGPWSGPVVTRVASGDPRFGPSTIVLANGRLVSNPLATITRFAGSTRSDGQFTLEPLHIVNVGAGSVVRFGRFRADATLRILNVLNGGTDQVSLSGGNQVFSPNYRLAGQRQAPRAAQFALRFDF
jgi:hypothetical protein